MSGGIAEILRTRQAPAAATASESWRRGVQQTSMGGHPKQSAELRKVLRERTGHEYEIRDGDPVCYSRKEQADCARALGMVNRGTFGGRGKRKERIP